MAKRVEVETFKLEGASLAERGKFAQAYEYLPPEDELLEKRGRLFVVLDISAAPPFDSALAGKLVWDSLSEEYYSQEDEPPLKALEQAVISAKNHLANLAHPPKENKAVAAKGEVGLNLVAAVIWEGMPDGGGVLYLARHGNPTIFLKRGGHVRELLVGEESTSIASLVIEDGDALILGSRSFGKSFSPKTLPELSFLKEEFERGRQVAGMAALILTLKVAKGVESTEVVGEAKPEKPTTEPFDPVREMDLPSPQSILGRLPRRKESLPFPSDKVQGGIRRVTKRIGEGFRARVGRGQEIYLEKGRPEIGLPKVIAVLILIFFLSAAFTLWQQRQRARAREFSQLLSAAEEVINEAEDLVGLSDERAKELWVQASEALDKATAINPKDERLISLSQKATTLFNRIEKITPVTEKHLFYDLTLQQEEVQALSLTGAGRFIYVADGKGGVTLAIKRTTPPQVEEATANEIRGARKVVAKDNFLYLLGEKIFYRYNLKTKKKDTPLGFNRLAKVSAFDLYLGGNIYLLVPSENQIYKFLNLGDSYSGEINWLREPLVLKEAVDLAVDGFIWVLDKTGTVFKLVTGEKEPFSFRSLPTALSQPVGIYTRPNFKKLYIADADRVLVFEKNGLFIKQFKGEVLSNLVDLWVSDDEKQLFLLTGDKIFKVGL